MSSKKADKAAKIDPRFGEGIFVGVRARSNELMIATPEGLVFTRTVYRKPVQHRWTEDCVRGVKWAPWNKYKGDDDADGVVPDGVEPAEDQKVEEVAPKDWQSRPTIVIKTKEKVPRRFQIMKDNVD